MNDKLLAPLHQIYEERAYTQISEDSAGLSWASVALTQCGALEPPVASRHACRFEVPCQQAQDALFIDVRALVALKSNIPIVNISSIYCHMLLGWRE